MIGLDTNVLVRYFAQDDAVQSAKATDLIWAGSMSRYHSARTQRPLRYNGGTALPTADFALRTGGRGSDGS